MKYSNEISIDLPINKVVELFDNPDNLKKWQPGLQSFEFISGEIGKPGAKSRLKFQLNKRNIEMIETISVRNLPEEFSATYETKGVLNISKNFFIAKSDNETIYKTENEFKCSGVVKIIAFLMPWSFKKQTQKYLKYFKDFAEKEGL